MLLSKFRLTGPWLRIDPNTLLAIYSMTMHVHGGEEHIDIIRLVECPFWAMKCSSGVVTDIFVRRS
jgi:hypothetical protein